MRKKIKYLAVIVLACAVFSGCTEAEVEQAKETSMFVIVEQCLGWRVVYHKETKVMYAVSCSLDNTGYFTLLVNPDGTPQTWKGV